MLRIRSVLVAGLLPLLAMAAPAGFAQDAAPPPAAEPAPPQDTQPQPQPEQQSEPAPDQQQPATATYATAQLDQMLAPIALYPDTLLTQILMASTYPIQIVEAERWLQDPRNAALHGDALVAALQPMAWDPSVKSLVPFPQIVKQLNDNLDWTQSLGTAFAYQQADVMDRVQALRQQAESAGKLVSTPQLRVAHQGPAVVIEPADPAMVYVPVYNPAVVYGAWAYAEYPPFYFAPPPGFFVGSIGLGIGFSIGFGVVGPLWGWGHPVWGEHNIFINNAYYSRISHNHEGFAGSTWHHAGPVGRVGTAAFHGPGGGRSFAGAHHAAAGGSGGHRMGHAGGHGSSHAFGGGRGGTHAAGGFSHASHSAGPGRSSRGPGFHGAASHSGGRSGGGHAASGHRDNQHRH